MFMFFKVMIKLECEGKYGKVFVFYKVVVECLRIESYLESLW